MQTTKKKFSITYFLRRESFSPQTHFSIANFFVKNKTRQFILTNQVTFYELESRDN